MELINISTNNLLFSSKEEVKELAFTIFDSVESGDEDPVKALAVMHKIGLICKEVETNLRPLVLKQINSNKTSKFGITLSQVKTGSTFDYSGTGDKIYELLVDSLKKAQLAVKAREAFLKALDGPMDCYDPQTGETYTIHPPINTYSESLKIDF